jgi:hypothetical protein
MAQYSENFELGLFWTVAIACFVWLGVRSVSWFLFASYGTPTIKKVIQGKGLSLTRSETKTAPIRLHSGFSEFMEAYRKNSEWISAKGEDVLNAFILPPLQIIAATINFCILLISGKHLFELPFKMMSDFTRAASAAKPKPAPVQTNKPQFNSSPDVLRELKMQNE